MTTRDMVVVGAGASTRFGADKLMAEIDGKPLIAHTIDAVSAHVDVCVVVCRREISAEVARLGDDIIVAAGGETRTRSEMAGLAAIEPDVDLIGIHDAARPLVSASTIEKLFTAAQAEGGAVPLVAYDGLLVDRDSLRPVSGLAGAQTPQVFRARELLDAYERAARAEFDGHDTAEVVERFGEVKIVAIEGDPANLKVTFPSDLDEVRKTLSGPSRT